MVRDWVTYPLNTFFGKIESLRATEALKTFWEPMAKKPLSTGEIERAQGTEGIDLPKLIHRLGNSLVPIVVHSELGLSLCEDDSIRSHFKKIHTAAQHVQQYVSTLREQEMSVFLRSSD